MGSTTELTDVSGNIVSRSRYDTYGNRVSSEGVNNKYGFVGEQFDSNLDNYYLRDRYYDAKSGRFTRRDFYPGRLEEPLTLHKYIYTHNNPVNGIDPSGFMTVTEINVTQILVDSLAVSLGVYNIGSRVLDDGRFLAESFVPSIPYFASTNDDGNDTYNSEYEEIENRCRPSKRPPQNGKTPNGNQRQNKSFQDALREIGRLRGKSVNKAEQRRIHDRITKKGLDFHEIIEEGLKELDVNDEDDCL